MYQANTKIDVSLVYRQAFLISHISAGILETLRLISSFVFSFIVGDWGSPSPTDTNSSPLPILGRGRLSPERKCRCLFPNSKSDYYDNCAAWYHTVVGTHVS